MAKIDKKDVKCAAGYWDKVFFKLAPELNDAVENIGGHVPCPFPAHPNSKDGFKLFPDAVQTGGGVCNTCGKFPTGIKLLMHLKGWTLQECQDRVLASVEAIENEGIKRIEVEPGQEQNTLKKEVVEELEVTINKTKPDNGRISKYLLHRGLSGEVPRSLLLYPMLRYSESKSGVIKKYRFDTMVARVQSVAGETVALHFTYFSGQGDGKAKVLTPKKFSKVTRKGALKGAAIYLGDPAETMGIAEGIETALAVQEATDTPMMVAPSNVLKFAEFPSVVKCVEIWCDNDVSGVGQKAADALAERLIKKGYQVSIMLPPEIEMDWADINESIDFGPETIVMAQKNALVHEREVEEVPYRKPLQREKIAPIPYPMEALGDFLGGAAGAIKELTQAPGGLCAQSLLATASLVVQAHANVLIGTRDRPLSCFFFTLGESGERKSTVDDLCLKPVLQHEADCRVALKKKREEYRIENDVHEARIKQYTETESAHEQEDHSDSIGAPPIEPHGACMIAGDPTIEGLLKFMVTEQPSMGLFSDEGGRVVGGHGMQQDSKMRTASGLSVLWDGKSVSSQRARGNVSVNGRRISVHLLMQPGVAEKFLADGMMKEQGFLSRILITEPESTIGTRVYRKPDPKMFEIMEEYNQRMLSILRRGYTFKDGSDYELEPRGLPVSEDGMVVYINFYNEIEMEQGESGAYSEVRGFASKVAEHAARLAGVLTLIEDIEAEEVTGDKMEAGVDLARYYLHEAKRQIGASSEDPILDLAGEVLKWMQDRGEYHALVEIYQKGPMGVRSAAKANEVLEILEDHGWIERVGKREINGKMRREVWRLVPDKE